MFEFNKQLFSNIAVDPQRKKPGLHSKAIDKLYDQTMNSNPKRETYHTSLTEDSVAGFSEEMVVDCITAINLF